MKINTKNLISIKYIVIDAFYWYILKYILNKYFRAILKEIKYIMRKTGTHSRY